MSNPAEWALARDTRVTLAARGDAIPGYEIPVEEDHAVLLDGGGALYVLEGSATELAALLLNTATQLLPRT